MKDFAETLKQALKYSGLSQQELADCLHVSKQLISHYVNGRATPNNIKDFEPMAKILDVNPAWLAGFDVVMDATKYEPQSKELRRVTEKLKRLDLFDLGKIDNQIDLLLTDEKYRQDKKTA